MDLTYLPKPKSAKKSQKILCTLFKKVNIPFETLPESVPETRGRLPETREKNSGTTRPDPIPEKVLPEHPLIKHC